MALIRYCGLLVAMLFCGLAFGQASAQIDGPAESQAGNLVVLNSVASNADVTEWVIPDTLAGRYIQTGNQLAFSVREAGAFTFHLVAVVVDETGPDIDVASHTVTITDGFGTCPVPDPNPGEPDKPGPVDPPQPSPDFGALAKLSEDAARQLNDSTTAKALATFLESVQIGDLETMKATVSGGVEAVFLGRNRESQDKDWLNVWRRPIADAIDVTTADDYLAAINAVASGLRSSLDGQTKPPSNPPTDDAKPKIKFYTRSNCGYCQRWKEVVKPDLIRAGWVIEEITSNESVPQFEVTVGSKTKRFVGYQMLPIFLDFAKSASAGN